jgi:2-phospho-L-lactate guanylyltransferase
MTTGPVVAIPIRSFTAGKTRLRAALDPAARRILAWGMAERAVTAADAAGANHVVIVAGSPEVRGWASGLDLAVLDDAGSDLNRAAAAAAGFTVPSESPWVILHADLPLVTGEALAPVVAAASEGSVIAPSYDGGTAALGGVASRSFNYGPASFQAHFSRTPGARVIIDYRLALDIDTPRDLEIAAGLPGGTWLRPLLGSLR